MATCYNCEYIGKTGKDDVDDAPIAWCFRRGCIVSALNACAYHPDNVKINVFYERSRKAWKETS